LVSTLNLDNVSEHRTNNSTGCVLLKRIRGEPLPPARWGLGSYGVYINAFYCAFIIVWSCFPATLPISLADANWSPLVWIATIIFTIAYYYAYGKARYTAPVEFVEGHRAAGVGLQHSSAA
jgi:choline transport protein